MTPSLVLMKQSGRSKLLCRRHFCFSFFLNALPIFLVLTTASGWKSAPLRPHFQCDACGIDTIARSQTSLAANAGPPFLPILVGSVCHDNELRVSKHWSCNRAFSVSLCWPGGHWLAALIQPGNKEFSIPLLVRWLRLSFFTLDDMQFFSTCLSNQDRLEALACFFIECILMVTSNSIFQATEKEEMLVFRLPLYYIFTFFLSEYFEKVLFLLMAGNNELLVKPEYPMKLMKVEDNYHVISIHWWLTAGKIVICTSCCRV